MMSKKFSIPFLSRSVAERAVSLVSRSDPDTDKGNVAGNGAASQIEAAIMKFAGDIPLSQELPSDSPKKMALAKAHAAASRAAMVAGSLALPPGPLGWLTILPEMLLIWKIQSQMVADIAAIYGKSPHLNQEHMLYCLFRHSAAQAVRDLVARVGDRMLIQGASLKLIESIAHKIGVQVSQQIIGKGMTRFLPVVGAIGVGAYAYYDSRQVATTAIALFEQEKILDQEE
jgi:hypothetical protein